MSPCLTYEGGVMSTTTMGVREDVRSLELARLMAEGRALPPAVPGGSAALSAMPAPAGAARDSAADLDQVRADR
jgi:hypothetical protein